MSNSFYGGRDGRPFIISHRYKTIEAMLTSISSDSDFSTFPVGEYCIINTDDLNHPDNGKIFRRNFPNGRPINQNKKNKDGGYTIESIDAKGMQLIGQIVGPAGPAAKILLENYDTVEAKKTNSTLEGQYDKYETEGDLTLTKGDILDPSLNNKIYWTSCALRDKDNKDSTCYVGFKIPYTKINIKSESVSPYYTESLTVWEGFSKLGEEINVFSQNWLINIPKGIHGQNIQDFALDKNTGIMTYSIRNYDKKESGEDTSYTLNEKYPLTWITSAKRPENTQILTIDFNNSAAGIQHIEANLKTPNSIYTTEDGLFKADYNTGETETLGRMFYQGAEEPTDLTIGGLWIETVEVGE